MHTQGASQVTGRTTDLAIQGDGYFVVEADGDRTYTRAGVFNFDDSGNLMGTGGTIVQGWMPDATGAIDTNRPVEGITIPTGQLVDPIATTSVILGGNLSADTVIGDTLQSSINVFDSLGTSHEAQFTFTKTGTNAWSLTADLGGSPLTVSAPALTFDPTGALTSAVTRCCSAWALSAAAVTVKPVGSDENRLGIVFTGHLFHVLKRTVAHHNVR